jgi:hypothetical protein
MQIGAESAGTTGCAARSWWLPITILSGFRISDARASTAIPAGANTLGERIAMQRLGFKEVASALGQSEYTIRAIAGRFVLYIPAARIGEDLFFRPEAVDIFRLIVQQLEVGIRDEYIELMLSKRYPVAEVSIMAVSGTIATEAFQSIDAQYTDLIAPGRYLASDRSSRNIPFDSGFSPEQGHQGRAGVNGHSGVHPGSGQHPIPSPDANSQTAASDSADALLDRIDQLEQRLKSIEIPLPQANISAVNMPATADREDENPQAAARALQEQVAPRRGFDGLPGRNSA